MRFIVIPGTKNPEHIEDNFNIFDFELTDDDMQKIATINKNIRYYTRTDEQLENFKNWHPDFENQK